MARSSAPTTRAINAVESFQTAGAAIGPITPGMSLFAITRGQWSMIDAILWCLDQVGPARLSIWTWTIADYEVEVFRGLQQDGRVTSGRLVIDAGARGKNAPLLRDWQARFGLDSIRFVVNHAKIATIETADRRLLLRGSMNLNFNPRFEQFDLSEGGPAFDLVREIEDELPILPSSASGEEVYRASKVAEAFEPDKLALFGGLKRWAK